MEGGITAHEVAYLAARWWDGRGRYLSARGALKNFNRLVEGRKATFFAGGGMLVNKGESRPLLPSGILRGLPWLELTAAERFTVAKAWHAEWLLVQRHQVVADATAGESQYALDRGFTAAQLKAARKLVAALSKPEKTRR